MIETRKQQILAPMTALRKERYSNADKLQEALDFEHELYRAAFDGADMDKPRFADVITRLMELDAQAGSIVTDKIRMLDEMLAPLGDEIAKCLSGRKGERQTFNILKTLSCPKIILRNVELTAAHMHCEIDLLVITPKVLFCIEVKNYKHEARLDENGNIIKVSDGKMYDDNLAERVRCREHILRTVLTQALGEDASLPDIKTYLVLADPRVRFVNEFPFIDSCCSTAIANIIEQLTRASNSSEMDMVGIQQSVQDAYDIHEYPLGIDVDAIRLLFAEILATLECARETPSVLQAEPAHTATPVVEKTSWLRTLMIGIGKWFRESQIPRYAGFAAAGTLVGGYVMKLKYDRR